MHTSLAQVFGAGEGIVLQGGQAVVNKDKGDSQPHLTEEDAATLLRSAIAEYTLQHDTPPSSCGRTQNLPVLAGRTSWAKESIERDQSLRPFGICGASRNAIYATRYPPCTSRNRRAIGGTLLSSILERLYSLSAILPQQKNSETA